MASGPLSKSLGLEVLWLGESACKPNPTSASLLPWDTQNTECCLSGITWVAPRAMRWQPAEDLACHPESCCLEKGAGKAGSGPQLGDLSGVKHVASGEARLWGKVAGN